MTLCCMQVAANKVLRGDHFKALEEEFAVTLGQARVQAPTSASASGPITKKNVLPLKRVQNIDILLKSWKMNAKQVR